MRTISSIVVSAIFLVGCSTSQPQLTTTKHYSQQITDNGSLITSSSISETSTQQITIPRLNKMIDERIAEIEELKREREYIAPTGVCTSYAYQQQATHNRWAVAIGLTLGLAAIPYNIIYANCPDYWM